MKDTINKAVEFLFNYGAIELIESEFDKTISREEALTTKEAFSEKVKEAFKEQHPNHDFRSILNTEGVEVLVKEGSWSNWKQGNLKT